MTQQEVAKFLKKNKKKWFNNVEISKEIGISRMNANRNCLRMHKAKEIRHKTHNPKPNGRATSYWRHKEDDKL